MLHPPEWTRDASCLGLWHDFDAGHANSLVSAVCEECPVSAQCALWMLMHEVSKGVEFRATYAAGLTAKDRAKLDARASACVGCGTETGKGPCEPCVRKGKHQMPSTGKPKLGCIQCGVTVSHGKTHCTHCVPRHPGHVPQPVT